MHPYPLPWLNNLQVPGFWTQLPQICPGLDMWHTNATMVHCLDVCNSTFIQLLICIYFIPLVNCLLVACATSMKLMRSCNALTRCNRALRSWCHSTEAELPDTACCHPHPWSCWTPVSQSATGEDPDQLVPSVTLLSWGYALCQVPGQAYRLAM